MRNLVARRARRWKLLEGVEAACLREGYDDGSEEDEETTAGDDGDGIVAERHGVIVACGQPRGASDEGSAPAERSVVALWCGDDGWFAVLASGRIISENDGAVGEIHGQVSAAARSAAADIVAIGCDGGVILLNAQMEPICEQPLLADSERGVVTSLSWRGDGEFLTAAVNGGLVVLTREGTIDAQSPRMRAVSPELNDDDGDDADDRFDDENHNGRRAAVERVCFQARVGGYIAALTRSRRRIRLFERHAAHRHSRADLLLPSAGEAIAWDAAQTDASAAGAETALLAVSFVDGSVGVYRHLNYDWSCVWSFRKSLSAAKEAVERPFAPVVDLLWDTERIRQLSVVWADGDARRFELQWRIRASDDGTVAMVHGSSLRLTNLSRAIVPPPLCEQEVLLPANVNAVGFHRRGGAHDDDVVAAMTDARLAVLRRARIHCLLELGNEEVRAGGNLRFVLSPCEGLLIVVAGSVDVFGYRVGVEEDGGEDGAPPLARRLGSGDHLWHRRVDAPIVDAIADNGAENRAAAVWVATSARQVHRLEAVGGASTALLDARCNVREIRSVAVPSQSSSEARSEIVLVLSVDGCLRALLLEDEEDDGEQSAKGWSLCRECTTFATTSRFLVFTTRSNLLIVLPLFTAADGDGHAAASNPLPSSSPTDLCTLLTRAEESLGKNAGGGTVELPPPEKYAFLRPIDGGSWLVAALSDELRVVLQAPRGNLETVVPRPMAHFALQQFIRRRDYLSAFRLWREQRLDVMVFVDDEEAFRAEEFVAAVARPSWLSSFAAALATLRAPRPPSVAGACERFARALIRAQEDSARYGRRRGELVPAIVSSLALCEPPRVVDALRIIHEHTAGDDGELRTVAFRHLRVTEHTRDVTQLYRQALGSYDLRLALMVAQNTEMDPKLYRDELISLEGQSDGERRYEIDNLIGRYESALRHLHSFASTETCVEYTSKHGLYNEAAALLRDRGDDVLRRVRCAHAQALSEAGCHAEAALTFVMAREYFAAAGAYLDAGDTALAMAYAHRAMSGEVLLEFTRRVVEYLDNHNEVLECARLVRYELRDGRRAVDILAAAGEWTAALQWSAEAELPRDELLQRTSAAAAARCGECAEAVPVLEARRRRLAAVRAEKQQRAERGEGGAAAADSDAYPDSDAGSMASDFTFASRRSTSALSSSSGRPSESSTAAATRRREKALARKAQRKKKRIYEGHPQEEEYLVENIRSLFPTPPTMRHDRLLLGALYYEDLERQAEDLFRAVLSLLECVESIPTDVRKGLEHLDLKTWTIASLSSTP